MANKSNESFMSDPQNRYFAADLPSALTTSTISVRARLTAGMTSMT
jgi:hypothetical protein